MKQGKPLSRSPMARGKSQLKTTKPMSRGTAPLRAKSAMKAGSTKKAPAQRSTLKTKGPKMTPIRRAARGQDCTIGIPGACNHDPATTVLCHSPFLADGRGMGLKAPDEAACFGCSSCHDVLDGRRPRPPGITQLAVEGAFYAGVRRTHEILRADGLIE